MFAGLPSRMEREMKQLYLQGVLQGDTSKLSVRFYLFYLFISKHFCLRAKGNVVLQITKSIYFSMIVSWQG